MSMPITTTTPTTTTTTTATATATTPSRLLEPQPGHTATAFGHAVAGGRPEETVPTDKTLDRSVALPQPSQDISHWQAPQLELILQHLKPADLEHAGRVCRRWHQTASAPSLQARSFIQSYPMRHRQRLERAMDARLVPQLLARWGEQLPAGSASRAERDWLLTGRNSSWQGLFHALAQQMLHAPHIFGEQDHSLVPRVRWNKHSSHNSPCHWSPDGAWLAVSHRLPPDQPPDQAEPLSLWQPHLTGAREARLCHAGMASNSFHQCAFSEDGRRLLAMEKEGYLQTWLLQPDDSWQLSDRIGLCAGQVNMCWFSPDARCLALAKDEAVLLFQELETGTWQQMCAHNCHSKDDLKEADRWTIMWQQSGCMQFSDDSRHFLYLWGHNAFVFDKCGNRWEAQRLTDAFKRLTDAYFNGVYGAGRLSPQASTPWLALIAYPRRFGLLPIPAQLQLWRYTEEQSWTVHTICALARSHLKRQVVTFSPDGQQLALRNRLRNGDLRLRVYRLTRSEDDEEWQLATRLRPGTGLGKDFELTDITDLRFSADGGYLAATVENRGVQLWQADDTALWVPVAWIETPAAESPVTCALAPDGRHCALAMGEEGVVSIQGPLPGRGYVSKMRLRLGAPVFDIQFSPDGSRLLLLTSDTQNGGHCLRFLQLTPTTRPTSAGGPESEEACADTGLCERPPSPDASDAKQKLKNAP